MQANTFFRRVQEQVRLRTPEDAEVATRIVFHALSGRLTQDEARHVESQLPQELKRLWLESNVGFAAPQLDYAKPDELFSLVRKQLNREGIEIDAESAVKAVIHTLKEQITEGEASDVLAQLPQELKRFWQVC